MNPPFLIDASLPMAVKVNADITNQQEQAFKSGPTIAALRAYTQNKSGFASDLQQGKVDPVSGTRWNELTTVQKAIYIESGIQPVFGDSQLDPQLLATMKANCGPQEDWNLSYEELGLVDGITGVYPKVKISADNLEGFVEGYLFPGQFPVTI